MPAEKDQHAGRNQFVFVQRPMIITGCNHQADDIITRINSPLLDDFLEIGRHAVSTIAGLAVLVAPSFGSSDE